VLKREDPCHNGLDLDLDLDLDGVLKGEDSHNGFLEDDEERMTRAALCEDKDMIAGMEMLLDDASTENDEDDENDDDDDDDDNRAFGSGYEDEDNKDDDVGEGDDKDVNANNEACGGDVGENAENAENIHHAVLKRSVNDEEDKEHTHEDAADEDMEEERDAVHTREEELKALAGENEALRVENEALKSLRVENEALKAGSKHDLDAITAVMEALEEGTAALEVAREKVRMSESAKAEGEVALTLLKDEMESICVERDSLNVELNSMKVERDSLNVELNSMRVDLKSHIEDSRREIGVNGLLEGNEKEKEDEIYRYIEEDEGTGKVQRSPSPNRPQSPSLNRPQSPSPRLGEDGGVSSDVRVVPKAVFSMNPQNDEHDYILHDLDMLSPHHPMSGAVQGALLDDDQPVLDLLRRPLSAQYTSAPIKSQLESLEGMDFNSTAYLSGQLMSAVDRASEIENRLEKEAAQVQEACAALERTPEGKVGGKVEAALECRIQLLGVEMEALEMASVKEQLAYLAFKNDLNDASTRESQRVSSTCIDNKRVPHECQDQDQDPDTNVTPDIKLPNVDEDTSVPVVDLDQGVKSSPRSPVFDQDQDQDQDRSPVFDQAIVAFGERERS